MALARIDGALLRDMFTQGSRMLEKNRAGIDALNVFPVPDGDTGTNMSLTMIAAAKEAQATASNAACDVADAAARGALKGARGNSGVILSQLLRGFAKGAEKKADLTAQQFAECLKAGSDMAYKAMMKPREGTILTVARVVAEDMAAKMRRSSDIETLLRSMIASGESVLKKTPDMLPVLKEAGVVDSGGMGLLTIYVGYNMALSGEVVELDASFDKPHADFSKLSLSTGGDEEFEYCTEFFIKSIDGGIEESGLRLREALERIGDCVLVVSGDDLLKVHVHSNHPGIIIESALEIGQLTGVKIDNMREQHTTIIEEAKDVIAKKPKAAIACVAVSPGDGISDVFVDLGVSVIVSGGQTMNPSIAEIIAAIEKANADSVFVLPNNSNITLAARQAAEQLNEDAGNSGVYVIPTTTVAQGMAAMLAFMPDDPPQDNERAMNAALRGVLSGEVTYAVRDSQFNGFKMKQGDILGMREGEIAVVGSTPADVLIETLDKMVTDESGIITIFYGEQVGGEEAQSVKERVTERFDSCDVEVLSGGQNIHYYLFSVE